MSLLSLKYCKDWESDGVRNAIDLPRSKSMAARALILNYIIWNRRSPENLPDCDDTRELAAALEKLADGRHGRFDLGTGGTSLRFFTALVASLPGFDGEVDCSDALRGRPLAPLVDALRRAGADIKYMGREGYPPLYIKGKKLPGGELNVDGKVSSQFASAILMASLLWENPVEIVSERMVSSSYFEMTRKMMDRLPVVEVEPDWSAAAFFYEYALLVPERDIYIRKLTVPGESVQGDSRCAEIFGFLGVETRWLPDGGAVIRGNSRLIEAFRKNSSPIEMNLSEVPDLVPALAVGMALAGIKYHFHGVSHLIYKESDRLTALVNEMEKLGFRLSADDGVLSWDGGRLPVGENEVIESHADHRIAMAMAVATVKTGWLALRDAECVSKSYPGFFGNLARLGVERQDKYKLM